MPLLGSNKTMRTERLVNNVYQPYLNQIDMRYEPVVQRSPHSYETRAEHISFQVMVDQIDIISSDRVLVDNRSFVAAGINTLDDLMGKHLEFVMRETNSNMHQQVTKLVLISGQPNYDPLFREWQPGTSKAYSSINLNVLMDQAQNAKNRYKMLIDGGKFNDIEWAMTLDRPDDVNTDDRVSFNGKLYKVSWVVDLVWEKIAGLETDVDNMPTSL